MQMVYSKSTCKVTNNLHYLYPDQKPLPNEVFKPTPASWLSSFFQIKLSVMKKEKKQEEARELVFSFLSKQERKF